MDMVTRQEFAMFQLCFVTITVLTCVTVTNEQVTLGQLSRCTSSASAIDHSIQQNLRRHRVNVISTFDEQVRVLLNYRRLTLQTKD
jgi:hypothetical protein